MRNERLMILRMIEEGKISANEGLALLEALEEEGPWPEGAGPREEQGPHGQGSEAQGSEAQDHAEQAGEEGRREAPLSSGRVRQEVSEEEPEVHIWGFRFDPGRVGEQVMRAVDQVGERLQDWLESGSSWLNDWLGDSYAFPAGEVGSLEPGELLTVEIRLPNGRVTVEPSPDERYHLEWVAHVRGADRERAGDRARQAVKVEREPGRLILRGHDRWWTVLGRVDVSLRLPPQGRYRLDLTSANASLTVRGIQAERLRARLANGDATVDGARLGALEMKAANGRIRVERGLADQVRLTTANGRVEFTGSARKARLGTSNGQVRASFRALTPEEAAGLPAHEGLDGMPAGEGVLAETVNGQIRLQLDRELAARALVQLRSLHGALEADLPELQVWQREEAPGRNRLEAAGPRAGTEPFAVEARSQAGSVQVATWDPGAAW